METIKKLTFRQWIWIALLLVALGLVIFGKWDVITALALASSIYEALVSKLKGENENLKQQNSYEVSMRKQAEAEARSLRKQVDN